MTSSEAPTIDLEYGFLVVRRLFLTASVQTPPTHPNPKLWSKQQLSPKSPVRFPGSLTKRMGNLASQCVAGAGARPLVVGPDGGRSWPEERTGVAELMIDAPGHVVARAADVTRERRVRPMAADELLRAGEVYLLVPAGRAGARLGDREVEAIRRLVSGKKKSRKSRPGGKVFPVVNGEEAVVEGKEAVSAGKRAQDHGLGPRQWRPVLDTIYEA